MNDILVNWSTIKNFFTSRNVPLQYVEENNFYHLKAFDSYFSVSCNLLKDNSDDVNDFEDNYKEDANKRISEIITQDGSLLASLSYGTTPQIATWKRRKHTATAGETNYFDVLITTEIRLAGGEYEVDNIEDVHSDDYIEFSLIDKDDVLGLFSTYGLTEGVDILELFKFVRQEYPSKMAEFYTNIGCAYIVVGGLYFRVAYVSGGSTNINFKTRILWYE
jgi:hypothetical protein